MSAGVGDFSPLAGTWQLYDIKDSSKTLLLSQFFTRSDILCWDNVNAPVFHLQILASRFLAKAGNPTFN